QQNALKMHALGKKIHITIFFSKLYRFRTRVQLPPAPPNHDPDTSGEVQKARTAQALRAFLCLSLSEDIRLNPEKIGTRLGTRYTVVH
ncbi:TPA: hypothetical protein ACYVBH_005258, partial [Klebsiella pneumoniae]